MTICIINHCFGEKKNKSFVIPFWKLIGSLFKLKFPYLWSNCAMFGWVLEKTLKRRQYFLAFLSNKNELFPLINTRIKNWPSGCGGSPQCCFGTLLGCSHCEGHDTSFAQTGILLTQKSLYSKLLIVLVKRKRISFLFWKLNGSFLYELQSPYTDGQFVPGLM